MKFFGVFLALFLLDFVWAKYTYAMTDQRVVKSGVYASVIILLSGLAQIGYTSDPLLLIPAIAGAFFGTALAVLIKRFK